MLHAVSAPGRICLVGEHCDYAKGMSVALPISHKVTAEGTPRNDQTISLISHVDNAVHQLTVSLDNLTILRDHILRYSVAALKALLEKGHSLGGMDVVLHSDLPMKKGLSSSAAISVATLKLFNDVYHLNMTEAEIAEFAYIAEHDILGIGCGRNDQIVSSYNSLVLMDYKNGGKPKVTLLQKSRQPMYILVGIPQADKRNLPLLLKASNKAYFQPKRAEDYRFKKALDTLIPEEVVLPFLDAVKKSDAVAAGMCLRKNQGIYDQYFVPVSDDFKAPLLYEFLDLAKNHGSLGEKWTGAGGAGAFICLTKTTDEQERLRQALARNSSTDLRFVTAIL